ncbi:MAG TPA: acyl-CoA dehydrogenase family protein [Anaeromyxobacteraceae bacterium]|nr:acyl-CoA dehydrogenase family protein [Anaeromyxobacteraceae bacterium]
MTETARTAAEIEKSRQVAEAARESEWKGKGFIRELFLGSFRLDYIHPYPRLDDDRPEFTRFFEEFRRFLDERVDPARIDETGEYPADVVEGLRKMGAFGMKIPKEYGGLGFTQREFSRAMQLLGGYDGSLTALLSAHQSIGVPQPVKLFGTEEQKKRFLPRCAAGAISAFALTETVVGSDPARLATTAEPTEDGKSFVLNGSKLWCTNGTMAELLVVMARNPKDDAISAFVVETSWPGVEVAQSLHFMGLRAISNAALRFTNVKVPRENLIGGEGRGLKIALTTLNTGRLTIPAAVTGGAKAALELVRKWANARVQWGQEVGKHEAITHKLADIGATTFAMEAVSDLAQALADLHGYDIRLEAAAAKEWNTSSAWRLIDTAMQVRGGRGYETERSLEARGETPVGVERWMRDTRINTIFEGSSEIMHLFMAREAVDKHLKIAGALIDPKVGLGAKLAALPKIAGFYLSWYPGLWLRGLVAPRYGEFGPLARHLRFVERRGRKLARQIFHAMVVFGARTERKQAFLFRTIDIANELFAMSATASRAHALLQARKDEGHSAVELAGAFCRQAARRVDGLFAALWSNDDDANYETGRRVLGGSYEWAEKGTMPIGAEIEDLRPRLPDAPAPAAAPKKAPAPAEV